MCMGGFCYFQTNHFVTKYQQKVHKESKRLKLLGVYGVSLLFLYGVDFINILQTAFTHADPKIEKKILMAALNFYSFGICESKSFS